MTKNTQLQKLLNDPRTGLKESSNTNKTRSAILSLFNKRTEKNDKRIREEVIEELVKKIPASLDIENPMTADEVLTRLDWILEEYKERFN